MPRIASTRKIINEDSLVDGVPDWMLGSITALVKDVTTEKRGRNLKHEPIIGVASGQIYAIERYLQIKLPYDLEDEFELQRSLINYAQNDNQGLDVVEALLAIGGFNNFSNNIFKKVNEILIGSGSKWIAVMQGEDKATLEERVDTTTVEAFEKATSTTSNNSGVLLKKAWGFAFGRSPSPSEAYNYAIKAMEASSWPIITPNNNSATLGHILGEMKAHPKNWHTEIAEQQHELGLVMIANAMQLVWEGHTDRHGTASPVVVSQESAEQAVFTAVMICSYFNRGYIA